MRRVLVSLLLLGGLAAGCASGPLPAASVRPGMGTPPPAVLQAVTHRWKGAALATVPPAAPACAGRGDSPSPVVTGDFNGDGGADVALIIQTQDGLKVVAALLQTYDYALTDVASTIDLTNAVLSIRRHGEAYRVPDVAVDNYLAADTIVVTPCGQQPTAYLWTGQNFSPQPLAS